jgi:hypothetical protein
MLFPEEYPARNFNFGARTFNIMTLSIITLSITTLNKTIE